MTAGQKESPTTYVEWRQLWNEEVKSLGWMVMHSYHDGQIHMTRELHQKLGQVRRIWDRLELEADVKDATWVRAFIEMIEGWNPKKKKKA